MKPVYRGVPQGLVLGPLLYTIYTNELPELTNKSSCKDKSHNYKETLFGVNCHCCGTIPCYADDASLIISNKTRLQNQNDIEEKLDNIKTFLNSNEITINLPKTTILEMMVKQKRVRVKGDIPQLETTNSVGQIKTITAKQNLRILGESKPESIMEWSPGTGRETTNSSHHEEIRGLETHQ